MYVARKLAGASFISSWGAVLQADIFGLLVFLVYHRSFEKRPLDGHGVVVRSCVAHLDPAVRSLTPVDRAVGRPTGREWGGSRPVLTGTGPSYYIIRRIPALEIRQRLEAECGVRRAVMVSVDRH